MTKFRPKIIKVNTKTKLINAIIICVQHALLILDKKFLGIIYIEFLEFVAAKFCICLTFFFFFVLAKNKNLYSLHCILKQNLHHSGQIHVYSENKLSLGETKL